MYYLLTGNPLLIAMAAIPAIVLLIYIYKKDTLEKEPTTLLIKLVVLGIISTAFATITESLGITVLESVFDENTIIYNLILYFFIVALSEEGFKYLLLKIVTWKNPEFDCQFDGIVYAVFVSLGFALWENIAYVVIFGFDAAIMRALTAVPGHASFAVFMGVFYGVAKKLDYEKKYLRSKFYRNLALITPVLVHGTYDFIATLGQNYTLHFFVFIALMFVIAFKLIKKHASHDVFINEEKSNYVAGRRRL